MVLQLLRFNHSRKICSRNDHRLVAQLRVGGGEGCNFNLRGVVEHVGNGRHSGHYTNYVLDDDVWYKISDMAVSIITEAELLGVEAYLCFYEARRCIELSHSTVTRLTPLSFSLVNLPHA